MTVHDAPGYGPSRCAQCGREIKGEITDDCGRHDEEEIEACVEPLTAASENDCPDCKHCWVHHDVGPSCGVGFELIDGALRKHPPCGCRRRRPAGYAPQARGAAGLVQP